MSASRKEREKKCSKLFFSTDSSHENDDCEGGDVLLPCWYVSYETGKFIIYKVIVEISIINVYNQSTIFSI